MVSDFLDGASLIELLQFQEAGAKLQERCARKLEELSGHQSSQSHVLLRVAADKAWVRHSGSEWAPYGCESGLPVLRLISWCEASPIDPTQYGLYMEWELGMHYFVHIRSLTSIEVLTPETV